MCAKGPFTYYIIMLGGSGRDYVIIMSFFKTEWRQKSVFDKKFFQHTTRVYAEYDPISHFDHNACFRVNMQNFKKKFES